MGIGSWLKGLFNTEGDARKPAAEPVEYKGYEIYAEPQAQGGQYRVQGRICKPMDDEVREHLFIRADLLSSADEASDIMVRKAKTFIDQMGDTIFD